MRTGSKNFPAYNPLDELEYIEAELGRIMLILGLDHDSFKTLSIDEMILSIRETFPWVKEKEDIACYAMLMEADTLFEESLRILWHRRQLALGAINAK